MATAMKTRVDIIYMMLFATVNKKCAGGDSNPQANGMRPSNARVYQFRHLRVNFLSTT